MSCYVSFLVAWRDNAKNNILGIQCNSNGTPNTAVYILDHVSLPPSTPNVSLSEYMQIGAQGKFLFLHRMQRPATIMNGFTVQFQIISTKKYSELTMI